MLCSALEEYQESTDSYVSVKQDAPESFIKLVISNNRNLI